ncbi:MAG TPA: hypothetical protein VFR85_10815 [Anaeromyxobacteraceae bacterium]|nr:hypothetical protein [Anaeromyxobacteraceae bacterium]
MTAIAVLALALAAGPGPGDRLLLCRPRVLGDPALARADAVAAAARELGQRFLDYGVTCESPQEAARAARRAGLGHAVSSIADGRVEGSRFVLTLSEAAAERQVAARELSVAPGQDPVAPIERALLELAKASEPPSAKRSDAPWYLVGAGAAVLAAGTGFALAAGSAAKARDDAYARGDAKTYVEKDASWRTWKTASGVALGVGAAAVAAGLTWRFAF